MPFRFGVVTLTAAPQCFVRARIRLSDQREGWGTAAELLAPKWFDKSPDLSNEDNFDQLRRALAICARVYQSQGEDRTAFGLHAVSAPAYFEATDAAGLPPLVASFGAALLDRAILDAVLRLEEVSVFEACRRNLFGLSGALTADLEGFDLDPVSRQAETRPQHPMPAIPWASWTPSPRTISQRRTASTMGCRRRSRRSSDHYGVTHFKIKVGGDLEADIDRLIQISRVLEPLPSFRATPRRHEQYADVEGVLALWQTIGATPSWRDCVRPCCSLSSPSRGASALSEDLSPLARLKPVEIDESDATLDAFLEAKALGYCGVSSKSCKASTITPDRARCAKWNQDAGEPRYFMSAEDLTTQAGLAVQQDLALATLIGCDHVERNGHHYVNGMAAHRNQNKRPSSLPHPDLYHRHLGSVRLAIEDGKLSIGSLDTPGLASAALPDLASLRHRSYEA